MLNLYFIISPFPKTKMLYIILNIDNLKTIFRCKIKISSHLIYIPYSTNIEYNIHLSIFIYKK